MEPVVSLEPEVSRIVSSALTGLKRECAKVLGEVDLRERPTAGVAEEFGITVDKLAVRLRRARRSAGRHVERMLG